MNGDAWSEVLLAAVTLGVAWREISGRGSRPGVAISMGMVGFAAVLGALLFSGFAQADGPHQFASLLTACAGFPLLAASLRWPDGALATRATAAARFVLIISAFAVLFVTIMQFTLWRSIAPALAAAVIMITALQTRQATAIAGGALLIACFALSLAQWTLALLDSAQQFHVLMAAALALLGMRPRNKSS